ncbi:MAG: glycosylase [Clostridia bacterium]|nr:glycosylase [Clostridia bacterium]
MTSDISSLGYVKFSDGEVNYTDETTRSVSKVAKLALKDLSDTREDKYQYPVDDKFSPCTAEGRLIFNADMIDKKTMDCIYEQLKTPYKYGPILKSDEYLYDCANDFKHDGKYYMAFIRIDKACSGGYESFLAKSDDLLHWTVLGQILKGHHGWDEKQTAGYVQFKDNRLEGSNELYKIGDKYVFSFLGGNLNGYETDPLMSGIAEVGDIEDLDSYKKMPEPILSGSDKDARFGETLTIYKTNMFVDEKMSLGHKFVCAYNAKNDLHRESIFLAVSDDGKKWTRYGDKAILSTFYDSDEMKIYGDPQVLTVGDYYVMAYFIYDHKKAYNTFAVSKDLRTWTKWDGKPLIQSEFEWENESAHKPWIIKENGIVYHYYTATNTKGERFIAVAASEPVGK